ncbi:FxSxx-COOH system tetratricopeptide repeat protein [Kineosporia babensis]|uniref:FxSxx-COOH system tetratricopeptide repeat protein n=1 Tax=Kineosporia babensis TaxID=499548 RepID=A0A9X1NC05_9ACTN|nr:FxSxx-COOH system tetratricopeptide repeat protein [Kineosporia babensis]MCD5310954.1 FxSxx-COOH system tetratricopeptide repeat protein [Kineosporia babensis]
MKPTTEPSAPAGRVLLLLDTHPTMQVWAGVLAELTDTLETLGLGTLTVQPVEMENAAWADVPPGTGPVVLVSDGACPAWRTASTARRLGALARTRPVVILHVLSQTRWYLTGIDPEPVILQIPAGARTNAQWQWLDSAPGADEAALPVPVLENSERGLRSMTQILTAAARPEPDENGLAAAALLLSEDPGEPEPAVAQPDPKTTVNEFRAAVSPQTFQLATYLAAVPLNLSVIQDLRARLMPDSSIQNLAEVLVSPLVRAENSSPAVAFRFENGVQQELLASARRADIERVVRAVSERPQASPGSTTFTTVLDRPPTPTGPLPTGGDPFRRRAETEWRTARALVLMALSGPYFRAGQRELDELINQRAVASGATSTRRDLDLMAVQSSSPAARSVLGDYPPRNQFFTGRDDLLADLHASLRSSRDVTQQPQYSGVTAVLPHALHGMGGVGKSLLAIEYLYRHANEYDVVWWISSERTNGIQNSLIMLGQRLGLTIDNEANTAVPAVLEALRRGEPYGNWLLVFDNAESPESVMPFLPKDGPGHILITSRDARWAQVARPLEVNVFNRDESKELLRRRGPNITDTEADQLAEALGDLPLAIEQAAAWHYETGMPAAEYLRLLSEKQEELLDQPAPIDYQVPVIAAWNVSLDQLEARNPAALQLLQVCAFFASEPIPRTLLTRARGQGISPQLDHILRNAIHFGNAVREISRYSLARIDHRNNAIQMHRLVQAALIARMSEEDRTETRHAAHRILAAADPTEPENPAEYSTYGSLYPHILASQAVNCGESWVRDLIINEVKYLYRWGDHEAAVEFGTVAYETWRQAHGPDDPQTLQIARWLAFYMFTIGRYTEAAELNATSLAVFERMREEGRPDPDGEVGVLGNIAIDRRVAGRFDDALTLSRELYDRALQRYGDRDSETLIYAHDLGVSLRLSGLFLEARDRDRATYELRAELFGPDHPASIRTQLGLLIDLRELGDYTDAVRLHEFELTRTVAIMGEINPTTLLARRLLAVAQRKAGYHDAALGTSELVSRQLRARYGNLYPETIAAESNYAIDLRQVGDLAEAERMGADVVQRYTSRLGAEHPHTLSARVNLAITYRLIDNPAQALAMTSTAYEALVSRLGPDHPSSLVAAANLGSDLFATGDPAAALAKDEDTWRRLGTVLGADHPTTLACESNLAMDLRTLGRTEESEERHRHALTMMEALLGYEHRAVREARSGTERANCDLDPMPL